MKLKNKPTVRQEVVFQEDAKEWDGLSLDSLMAKFEQVKLECLQKNPTFRDFVIGIDNDEYSIALTIWASRDETSEERTWRLEQAKRAKVARQLIAAKRKENELAQLKKLCKKLKITSPI